MSSTEHVGPLAENVIEKLKESDDVRERERVTVESVLQVSQAIEKVRLETKQKKKQMAMMMRKKQLSQMGMEMDVKGQLKVGLL